MLDEVMFDILTLVGGADGAGIKDQNDIPLLTILCYLVCISPASIVIPETGTLTALSDALVAVTVIE